MSKNIFLSVFLILTSFSLCATSDLLEVEKKTIQLYKDSVPSVVNVTNIKLARSFFSGTVEVPQGAGSGFVWDSKGHIVTNFHVVHGGNSFVVTFHNNPKQYKATIIGAEPKKDIAVLKLNEIPSQLVPVKIGESKALLVGQMTLAIGSPFGLDHTLTTGIVSALGRKIDGFGGVKIHDMIQTDAAINSGNSGGPLLDSSGRLIGMNTMIFSTSGSSAGLGFAVPVETIKMIVPQLITHGKVIRPGLGISILEDRYKEMFNLPQKGAILRYVDEDGPAGKAGLKGMMQDSYGRLYLGDTLIAIDGTPVSGLDDIFQKLEKYKIGETVEVTYLREGKASKVKIKLQAL
jgi:S1-C subfamily serine protease